MYTAGEMVAHITLSPPILLDPEHTQRSLHGLVPSKTVPGDQTQASLVILRPSVLREASELRDPSLCAIPASPSRSLSAVAGHWWLSHSPICQGSLDQRLHQVLQVVQTSCAPAALISGSPSCGVQLYSGVAVTKLKSQLDVSFDNES